jgi:hypothetical protein
LPQPPWPFKSHPALEGASAACGPPRRPAAGPCWPARPPRRCGRAGLRPALAGRRRRPPAAPAAGARGALARCDAPCAALVQESRAAVIRAGPAVGSIWGGLGAGVPGPGAAVPSESSRRARVRERERRREPAPGPRPRCAVQLVARRSRPQVRCSRRRGAAGAPRAPGRVVGRAKFTRRRRGRAAAPRPPATAPLAQAPRCSSAAPAGGPIGGRRGRRAQGHLRHRGSGTAAAAALMGPGPRTAAHCSRLVVAAVSRACHPPAHPFREPTTGTPVGTPPHRGGRLGARARSVHPRASRYAATGRGGPRGGPAGTARHRPAVTPRHACRAPARPAPPPRRPAPAPPPPPAPVRPSIPQPTRAPPAPPRPRPGPAARPPLAPARPRRPAVPRAPPPCRPTPPPPRRTRPSRPTSRLGGGGLRWGAWVGGVWCGRPRARRALGPARARELARSKLAPRAAGRSAPPCRGAPPPPALPRRRGPRCPSAPRPRTHAPQGARPSPGAQQTPTTPPLTHPPNPTTHTPSRPQVSPVRGVAAGRVPGEIRHRVTRRGDAVRRRAPRAPPGAPQRAAAPSQLPPPPGRSNCYTPRASCCLPSWAAPSSTPSSAPSSMGLRSPFSVSARAPAVAAGGRARRTPPPA